MIIMSELLESYRILGLLHHATLEDINKAHIHMHQLKPGTHPFGLELTSYPHQDKVQMIENAYNFLSSNFDDIQTFLASIEPVSYVCSEGKRSHWTVQEIVGYSHEKK